MSVLPLVLSLIAFGLLGMSTDAHHRRHFGHHPAAPRRTVMRIVAWLLLAAGFAIAIAAQGGVFGPILWAGTVMAGAALAFLALNLISSKGHR